MKDFFKGEDPKPLESFTVLRTEVKLKKLRIGFIIDVTRAVGGALKGGVVRGNENSVLGRPEIELYVKDGSHPSYAGSYLAAAVGYLTLFKEPFKADTPVRLKPEVAKYLRSVAERVVLKGEN